MRSMSSWLILSLDFQRFFALFGKLSSRFASRCSSFGHGCLGEAALVRRPRVAHELSEAGMSGDRANLVCGAASLGQSSSGRLAETMRRAVRQSGRIALLPEPVAERRGCKRPPVPRRQKCEVAARCRGNDGGKICMYGDGEDRPRLLLRYMQRARADVLRPHSDDIATPLPGVEQESECQAGARPNGMLPFE